MDKKLHDLIHQVQKEPHDNNTWLVLADLLQELGDKKGELISLDVALRNGLDHDEACHTLREAREKVWTDYGLDKVPDYLLQDQLWLGSFPLRFPNTKRLEELDGTFFTEDFPRYDSSMENMNSYANAVMALQRLCEQKETSHQPTYKRTDGSTMYRPLTFRENILARVEDFYTLYDGRNKRNLKDCLCLFNLWFDTCTGIAYKADSPNFKIIPECRELIEIPEGFNEEYLPIDYDSLRGDGIIELDRNDATYNQSLFQLQVLDHPAWNAVMEEDKLLLKEYTNIVFSQNKRQNMGFWLRDDIEEDQLRALFLSSLNYNSYASGINVLNLNGLFLAR